MGMPPQIDKIQTEKKKETKKQDYAMQQDTAKINCDPEEISLVEDDGTEDFGEFRDLFIQGHALNAEQIEAMDINLLELSLHNQMTEEGSEEMDMKRLESFSP
jgi:hypothetical protein